MTRYHVKRWKLICVKLQESNSLTLPTSNNSFPHTRSSRLSHFPSRTHAHKQTHTFGCWNNYLLCFYSGIKANCLIFLKGPSFSLCISWYCCLIMQNYFFKITRLIDGIMGRILNSKKYLIAAALLTSQSMQPMFGGWILSSSLGFTLTCGPFLSSLTLTLYISLCCSIHRKAKSSFSLPVIHWLIFFMWYCPLKPTECQNKAAGGVVGLSFITEKKTKAITIAKWCTEQPVEIF